MLIICPSCHQFIHSAFALWSFPLIFLYFYFYMLVFSIALIACFIWFVFLITTMTLILHLLCTFFFYIFHHYFPFTHVLYSLSFQFMFLPDIITFLLCLLCTACPSLLVYFFLPHVLFCLPVLLFCLFPDEGSLASVYVYVDHDSGCVVWGALRPWMYLMPPLPPVNDFWGMHRCGCLKPTRNRSSCSL